MRKPRRNTGNETTEKYWCGTCDHVVFDNWHYIRGTSYNSVTIITEALPTTPRLAHILGTFHHCTALDLKSALDLKRYTMP